MWMLPQEKVHQILAWDRLHLRLTPIHRNLVSLVITHDVAVAHSVDEPTVIGIQENMTAQDLMFVRARIARKGSIARIS